jgi:hypothetical protein
MPTITIKDLPEDLHRQLEREAEANFRSLDQEAAARIARTFDLDQSLNTKRDQKWVEEAIASGPETSFDKNELRRIRDQILNKAG